MTVRAKFRCDSITRSLSSKISRKKDDHGRDIWEPCEIRTVKLTPVYGKGDPNHENTKFWNATPTGTVELGCVNLAAAEAFEIGKEYYLDFTPAT